MAKKYKVTKGYEKSVIVTSKPEGRNSGRFDLSRATQADLKYLHDVVRHPSITIEEDAKREEK